jgi:16S rRNA processing protein RimM
MPPPKDASKTNEKRVLVARIGAPHGVRGDVKLWSFTAAPEAVGGYGPFESDDARHVFTLKSLKPAKDFFIAHFEGIDDRDAAARFTNIDLFVPRERLPPPGADEFYHADLIGLAAIDASGSRLGEVLAVHNFGAGDLLELKLDAARDTVMIAFTPETVPKVDLKAGQVVIAMPGEV